MLDVSDVDYPVWLQSFDDFRDSVQDAAADQPHASAQGAMFGRIAAVLLPVTPQGQDFADIEESPRKSHDDGVDLRAQAPDGRQLRAQAKLTISGKKELASIIGYFEHYERLHDDPGDALFSREYIASAPSAPRYLIVTLSEIDRIIEKYEESHISGREFYDSLRREGRIDFIQGGDLFKAARREFERQFLPPKELVLPSSTGWLSDGSCRIGVVPAPDLVALYVKFGDGLFFENIRSFLGLQPYDDRESVNIAIQSTARDDPESFLSMNNGITIRANRVRSDADGTSLVLETPSIVNGAQTTRCLVELRDERALSKARVLVKVVESEDAWAVTKAANYQNSVQQIELDLAQYFRPALVEKMAALQGVAIENAESRLQSLIDRMTVQRVTSDEMRYLYSGLFYSRPQQLFQHNYNKLRTEVLAWFHEHGLNERLFNILFRLNSASIPEFESIRAIYNDKEYEKFERLTRRPTYRAYLMLLGASSATEMNLDSREDLASARAQALWRFLERLDALLDENGDGYRLALQASYQMLLEKVYEEEAANDDQLRQRLHHYVSTTSFEALYKKTNLRLITSRR